MKFNIIKYIHNIITPKLQDPEPALLVGVSLMDAAPRHIEMRNIELANLRLQKEALEKNLLLIHRTMLITFLAVLVSLFLGIYAIKAKPIVKVEVKENKSTQVNKIEAQYEGL